MRISSVALSIGAALIAFYGAWLFLFDMRYGVVVMLLAFLTLCAAVALWRQARRR